MKNLPIGVSTFESIILSGALYVDKTKIIYELIKGKIPKRYFFSRPRRFGKSLTCSTLYSIFTNNKKLFKSLLISQTDYQWKSYPIIFFELVMALMTNLLWGFIAPLMLMHKNIL